MLRSRLFTFLFLFLEFSGAGAAPQSPSSSSGEAEQQFSPDRYYRETAQIEDYVRRIKMLSPSALVTDSRTIEEISNKLLNSASLEHEVINQAFQSSFVSGLDRYPTVLPTLPILRSTAIRLLRDIRSGVGARAPEQTGPLFYTLSPNELSFRYSEEVPELLRQVGVEDITGHVVSAWEMVEGELSRIYLRKTPQEPNIQMPPSLFTWKGWRYGYGVYANAAVQLPVLENTEPHKAQAAWIAAALVYHAMNMSNFRNALRAQTPTTDLWLVSSETRSLRAVAQVLTQIFHLDSEYVSQRTMKSYLEAMIALRYFDDETGRHLSNLGQVPAEYDLTKGRQRDSHGRLIRSMERDRMDFLRKDPVERAININFSPTQWHRFSTLAMFDYAEVLSYVDKGAFEDFSADFRYLFVSPPTFSAEKPLSIQSLSSRTEFAGVLNAVLRGTHLPDHPQMFPSSKEITMLVHRGKLKMLELWGAGYAQPTSNDSDENVVQIAIREATESISATNDSTPEKKHPERSSVLGMQIEESYALFFGLLDQFLEQYGTILGEVRPFHGGEAAPRVIVVRSGTVIATSTLAGVQADDGSYILTLEDPVRSIKPRIRVSSCAKLWNGVVDFSRKGLKKPLIVRYNVSVGSLFAEGEHMDEDCSETAEAFVQTVWLPSSLPAVSKWLQPFTLAALNDSLPWPTEVTTFRAAEKSGRPPK